MRAGVIRAEGVLTAAALPADQIVIQRPSAGYGQFIPLEITVANLLQASFSLQKTGINKPLGTAVLVAGTVTVANTSVTANSVIFLTIQALGTVAAPKAVSLTITPGTGFVITSSDNTDTSTIGWMIVQGV